MEADEGVLNHSRNLFNIAFENVAKLFKFGINLFARQRPVEVAEEEGAGRTRIILGG